MSGAGAPRMQTPNAAGLRVAVVAGEWHGEIVGALLDGVHRALTEAGVPNPTVLRVAGTFELPVAALRLASCHDAVIALGVVIRGGTPHFDYVCQAAALGLTDVAVRTGVPVGFGVLTCDTDAQAYERSGLPGSKEDKGYEVAQAALATALTLRPFPVGPFPIEQREARQA